MNDLKLGFRELWKNPGFIVVALLALAASTVARAQEETEHVDRTLAFPSGGTLQLHNFSGAVHITGTAGKDLVIKAVRRAERDRLDHIALDIQTSGSTVTIDANKRDPGWQHDKNNVVETSFEIEVPSGAILDVDVFSSNLDIKGVTGAERLKTFSGNVTVDAVAAGAVPRLTAETFSGGIRVRLADCVKGDVNFKSFSGSFDAQLPLTLHKAGHNRVSGALPDDASDSALRFTTFSGNVHLTK
ncbi:MAG: hypothetical protein DME23_09400 [Verrucomicrobia bacterium]|nr:MAG: hypothetical protein DME23_09400 [Verrucomicrobiota bacterium]